MAAAPQEKPLSVGSKRNAPVASAMQILVVIGAERDRFAALQMVICFLYYVNEALLLLPRYVLHGDPFAAYVCSSLF